MMASILILKHTGGVDTHLRGFVDKFTYIGIGKVVEQFYKYIYIDILDFLLNIDSKRCLCQSLQSIYD